LFGWLENENRVQNFFSSASASLRVRIWIKNVFCLREGFEDKNSVQIVFCSPFDAS
jgi:hypothetical protein